MVGLGYTNQSAIDNVYEVYGHYKTVKGNHCFDPKGQARREDTFNISQ
jgi:hypothetical protein